MILIDRRGNEFELRPENLEDLWVLSEFIAPEDMIFATVERKIKIGDDKTKQVRKLIRVDLLVKKVSFESEVVRVSGEIQNETEFTSIGVSQSVSIVVNDLVKLKKGQVLSFEEKLLKNSLESKKSFNLLILMDKEDLVVCEFGDFSYSVLFSKSGLGSKKGNMENISENEEKFKILESLFSKDYSQIVVAGPGFWKDEFVKFLKDRGIKSVAFSFPEVSSSRVQKAISEVSKSGLLSESLIAQEQSEMNEFLRNLDVGGKCSYGEEESFNAVSEGKVEKFLVSTEFISKMKEEGRYAEVSGQMKLVEQMNGSLVIINSGHEPGKVLDGLGGVASINRY